MKNKETKKKETPTQIRAFMEHMEYEISDQGMFGDFIDTKLYSNAVNVRFRDEKGVLRNFNIIAQEIV